MKKFNQPLFVLFISILLLNNIKLFGNQYPEGKDTICIAFWNLENLFDTVDDPGKNDEEFTPTGTKSWTEERLEKKLFNQARIIRMINDNKGPDILGVSEVEHQYLLDRMDEKFLNDLKYNVAYLESPDNRGIDNGLIYKSDKFSVISINADTIHLPDNYPTRLILNVNLISNDSKDTLYVFVNHWPSRRGGLEESEPNRIAAAELLRKKVDQIFKIKKNPNIIIIGDFNDEPANNSILKTLKATPFLCDKNEKGVKLDSSDELFNLSYKAYQNGEGTLKYRNDWNLLDQIIVSSNVIENSDFNFICDSYTIFKPWIILTHSGKYEGTPFPTYGGNRYLGGYSDHFPVYAKFILNK